MEDNGVRCYDLGIVHYSEVFRNMEMNPSLRPSSDEVYKEE
jgi:hypothetical protein